MAKKRVAEETRSQPKKAKLDPEYSEEEVEEEVDELDGGDYAEESAEEDDSPAGTGNDEENRPSREEQKKLLNERKLKRKSGTQVENIKRLWEKLRVKNPPMPKEIRDKLCDETWELSKDVIGDLVLKHDASRVVQTLVKYCSKERREIITRALKGQFYNLATSSYGKYLLIKLLHYGSKDSRELILSELHGKLRKLIRHREGAYVVEDLYVLYATSKQKSQMIKEFWGSEYAVFRDTSDARTIKEVCAESKEKRSLIANNLITTIRGSVDKGSTGFQILHAVMREYVQIFENEEVRALIELLQDQIAELVHTQEGCEVACTLIAKANAKERKNILKGLKPHGEALAKDEHGQLVLQIIFMTVDDTVLVNRTFSSVFKDTFEKLVLGKFSRRPFIYLLNGLDHSYFSPPVLKDIQKYMELASETSKKPQEQRRTELLKNLLPLFYETVQKRSILRENFGSQFALELILNNDFPEETEEPRKQLLELILSEMKEDLGEDHLLSKPFTSRLLKSLIQGGKWNFKEKKVDTVPNIGVGKDFAASFAETVFENGEDEQVLKNWINDNQGCFVLVALVEALKDSKKNSFPKKLKKLDKIIKKQDDDNKGAQLLLKVF
ncbi:hypothetical protein OGAPHI_004950 [Ogataea philodendri]|uniref:PUM-HD domain-containing protein n=1 Tax=Ogataea philodendri TaxID=1378263 RepID=A0A9P8P1V1_9ASCO|nr:uncharacterized protein OGAPHI_004950 [Ogataea philodendri]KAH3663549.1 hypothetical protein OGAPHI_004950 [Ogataea philodendri]